MKHTLFESIVPNIMHGTTVQTGEKIYYCPVADFGIAKIELSATLSYSNKASSLEIIIVTDGGAVINNSVVLKRGEAVAILPDESYTIEASGDATMFKAFVPALA